jgi:hypothetical protein
VIPIESLVVLHRGSETAQRIVLDASSGRPEQVAQGVVGAAAGVEHPSRSEDGAPLSRLECQTGLLRRVDRRGSVRAEPREVAYFVPPATENPVKPSQRGTLTNTTQVWGVVVDPATGLVYASDMNSGLWIVRRTG